MRLRRLAVVSAAGIAAASTLGPGTADGAGRRPISTYCSPSGDVCFGVFRQNRVVLLELTAAAHYFSRYTLCVKGPGTGAARYTRCGSFPVFRQGGSTWGSTVRHARQYPHLGPGVYRVTWKLDGRRLGPTLRFRLPLR